MDIETAASLDPDALLLRRDLLKHGVTDKQIRRHIRRGDWVPLRWGAYVPADRWTSLASPRARYILRQRAALAVVGRSVALSHTSALALFTDALWGQDLDVVHLTTRDGRAGRRQAGVAQHRGNLDESEVIELGPIVATSPARTAIDLTTIVDTEPALVGVNALLAANLVTIDQLVATRDRVRYWPGSLTTDLVLRLADGRCTSVGETRSFYMFWRFGLPKPEPQFEVRDRFGNLVGIADFAWPGLGVFAEFDGIEKYVKFRRPGETLRDCVLREKAREDAMRRATNWTCARLVWADLAMPAVTCSELAGLLGVGPIHRISA